MEDNDSTFDETNVLEEIYGITEKDSDEKSVLNEVDTQFDRILEMPRNDDIFGEYLDFSGVKEISDDNIKPLEEVKSIWLDITVKVIIIIENHLLYILLY